MYLEHVVSHTNSIFQPQFTHKEKSYKDMQHPMLYWWCIIVLGGIIIWKFPQMTGFTSESQEEVKPKYR